VWGVLIGEKESWFLVRSKNNPEGEEGVNILHAKGKIQPLWPYEVGPGKWGGGEGGSGQKQKMQKEEKEF